MGYFMNPNSPIILVVMKIFSDNISTLEEQFWSFYKSISSKISFKPNGNPSILYNIPLIELILLTKKYPECSTF